VSLSNPTAPEDDKPAPKKKAKRVITVEERERDFVIGMIALVLALTTLPHLFGYAVPKAGYRFVGTAYNIDDYLVYLSWLQQTAHGAFYIRNLFTTDQQPALLFNFLLSTMGWLIRVTHWSPQAVIEAVRIVGTVVLLVLIYNFYRFCIPDNRSARLTAFALACFSSGFGWAVWRIWANDNHGLHAPIDAWQPEAFTFTSIYTNVLFVVSTSFIIGVLYGMLLSVRTGKMRYAVIAGLCGFVLGDIHSYDVLHVCAAWGLFLVIWSILRWRSGILRLWVHSLLALGLTMITTGWVYHVFETNPVFKSRAESPTLTPPFYYYVAGYGFVFLFVIVAAVMLFWRRWKAAKMLAPTADDKDAPEGIETLQAKEIGWADRASLLFVWCWSIAGFIIIKAPFNFQRKMLMGEHIPLCLLAGWGAAVLTRRLSKPARIAVLTLFVAATFPSNALFIRRDMVHMSRNKSETQQWPVLSPGFIGGLDYLRDQVPQNAPVLSIPFYATYVPGFTGHAVWAGHWSETPNYGTRVQELIEAFDVNTPEPARMAFLQSTKCQYLLYLTKTTGAEYTDKHGRVHQYVDLATNPPSYLKPVYSNKEFTVFRIDLPPQ
jgi:hypothetical protein